MMKPYGDTSVLNPRPKQNKISNHGDRGILAGRRTMVIGTSDYQGSHLAGLFEITEDTYTERREFRKDLDYT